MNVFCMVYVGIVYFTYAISKWSAIFKYSFFVSIIWAAAIPMFVIIIVPLASMYASL